MYQMQVPLIISFVLASIGCRQQELPTVPDDQNVSQLHAVYGAENPARQVDIVFLHGVDGNFDETWQPPGKPELNWAKWLGSDNPSAAIWSIEYPISTKSFVGETMGLLDRARNLLALLDAHGFGDASERDLIFVGHSFGGLVIKEMLRTGSASPERNWQAIAARTDGVVFIATPNSGSDLADFVEHVAGRLATRTVTDLQPTNERLLELNRWYRNAVVDRGIETLVFCEKQKTGPFMVVPEASADLGVAGIEPIVLDRNHINICKPSSRDDTLYLHIDRFVKRLLEDPPPALAPNPAEVCADIPSAEQVQQASTVAAEGVVLHCQNMASRRLSIAIFDWSRYYSNRKDVWRVFPLPISSEVQVFEHHFDRDCTGWFSIFVLEDETRYSPCLETTNLFFHRKPLLRVVENAGDLKVEVKSHS